MRAVHLVLVGERAAAGMQILKSKGWWQARSGAHTNDTKGRGKGGLQNSRQPAAAVKQLCELMVLQLAVALGGPTSSMQHAVLLAVVLQAAAMVLLLMDGMLLAMVLRPHGSHCCIMEAPACTSMIHRAFLPGRSNKACKFWG